MKIEGCKYYTCVNCGENVQELYKMYSPTVLKLCTCEKCNQLADKYIEYDPIIIMIDLVLLKKEAYRHFLYNAKFKNYWKIAIFIQIMEAFSEWVTTMANYNNFEKDVYFYLICIKAMIGGLLYIIILYTVTLFVSKYLRKSKELNFSMIIKVYAISGFGQFFLLSALIWSDYVLEHINFLLVFLYTSLCHCLVYSFVSSASKTATVIIVTISSFLKSIFINFIHSLIFSNQ